MNAKCMMKNRRKKIPDGQAMVNEVSLWISISSRLVTQKSARAVV